jgi:hypothetical protein
VAPKYARSFKITTTTLAPAAKGWLQALLFTPKIQPSAPRSSFYIINVYLPSGTNHREKKPMLRALLDLNNSIPAFVSGDFNFTETYADNPSTSSRLTITGSALSVWEKAKSHLRLREVHQPAPTHLFHSNNNINSRSSRIDRHYSSLSEAEEAVLLPKCYARASPGFGHTTLSLIFGRRGEGSPSRPRSCPSYLADNLPFMKAVRARWGGAQGR